jgi:putative chitinase
MIVLDAHLLKMALGCSSEKANLFAEPMRQACAKYSINTPNRLAFFFAEGGHETESLVYLKEIWGPTEAQRRYEPPGRKAKDLGNTEVGDGKRFLGRGFIQLTGRYNYLIAYHELKNEFGEVVPNFELHPELVEEPKWACLTAAEFWFRKGLNELADAGDFERITRIINGALTNYEDRLDRRARAEAAIADAIAAAQAGLPEIAPVGVPTPAPLPTPPPLPETSPAGVPGPSGAMPKGDKHMIPALIGVLASSLIEIFSPIVKEKITKELSRHTKNPEIAEGISERLVDKAMELTSKTDPIAAVAVAKDDPTIVKTLEDHTISDLDKLVPLLDKLAVYEQAEWTASEESMDAAAERGRIQGPDDQDVFLTRAIIGLVVGLMFLSAVLTGVALWMHSEAAVIQLLSLITMGFGVILGKFGTRYDHRYGSSRNSSTKDFTIKELSKRA